MIRRLPFRVLTLATALGAPLLNARPAVAQASTEGRGPGPRIVEVQIAPPYLRMLPDAQVQLSATAYDSSGTPVNARFRWSSNNVNVAVVTENGMVRAVAPGATLISATLEERGRRRVVNASVRVMQPGPPAGVLIGPPAMAAPAPTATPVPGVAPGVPTPPAITVGPGPGGAPMGPREAREGPPPRGAPPTVSSRTLDSAFKATINCGEPIMNSANPLQACYDQRPVPRGSRGGPLTLAVPEACAGTAGRVLLLVHVSEIGDVTEVMPFAPPGMSTCPQFSEAAITAARASLFVPAVRAGRPVAAWVRLFYHPQTETKP